MPLPGRLQGKGSVELTQSCIDSNYSSSRQHAPLYHRTCLLCPFFHAHATQLPIPSKRLLVLCQSSTRALLRLDVLMCTGLVSVQMLGDHAFEAVHAGGGGGEADKDGGITLRATDQDGPGHAEADLV
jgi:hypothetical protein